MTGNDTAAAAVASVAVTAAAGHVERILARYALSHRDVLLIVLFAYRPGGLSLVRAIFDYVRGVGPAAVAAGRVGVRTAPNVVARACVEV